MRSHHACYLLSLLVGLEDGGNMFFRNVGRLSPDYTTLYPKDRTFNRLRAIANRVLSGGT
jgi:hypothetical protein